MFVHPENTSFPNSWKMIEEMFIKNGNENNFLTIREYYEKFGDSAFNQFATDYAFQMPFIKLTLYQKEYEAVYMYKFNYISNYGKKSGLGACH